MVGSVKDNSILIQTLFFQFFHQLAEVLVEACALSQISESRCGRCIRTADYMYSVYAPGVNGGEAAASDVYADDFLYDMQKDPWQLNNVVADPAYADVKAELRERLLNWIQHAEGTRPTITD